MNAVPKKYLLSNAPLGRTKRMDHEEHLGGQSHRPLRTMDIAPLPGLYVVFTILAQRGLKIAMV